MANFSILRMEQFVRTKTRFRPSNFFTGDPRLKPKFFLFFWFLFFVGNCPYPSPPYPHTPPLLYIYSVLLSLSLSLSASASSGIVSSIVRKAVRRPT